MDIDERLVIASDTLILSALSRAFVKTIGRGRLDDGRSRWDVPSRERHEAYRHRPVPETKIEAALADAWHLAPTVIARHQLDIDVSKWVAFLDGYTRALLMAAMPHTLERLLVSLSAVDLSLPENWVDDESMSDAEFMASARA